MIKTEVSELPAAVTKQWKRQVGNPQSFNRNGVFDYISARSYFDSAIEVMQNNKENAAILNYAIKTLPVEKMSNQAKTLCVKPFFIYVCCTHIWCISWMSMFFSGLRLENMRLKFYESLFKQEHRLKNYDAVCYSIYFSLKYEFPIEQICAQDAIDSDSSIYKLLSFYISKEKQYSGKSCVKSTCG